VGYWWRDGPLGKEAGLLRKYITWQRGRNIYYSSIFKLSSSAKGYPTVLNGKNPNPDSVICKLASRCTLESVSRADSMSVGLDKPSQPTLKRRWILGCEPTWHGKALVWPSLVPRLESAHTSVVVGKVNSFRKLCVRCPGRINRCNMRGTGSSSTPTVCGAKIKFSHSRKEWLRANAYAHHPARGRAGIPDSYAPSRLWNDSYLAEEKPWSALSHEHHFHVEGEVWSLIHIGFCRFRWWQGINRWLPPPNTI